MKNCNTANSSKLESIKISTIMTINTEVKTLCKLSVNGQWIKICQSKGSVHRGRPRQKIKNMKITSMIVWLCIALTMQVIVPNDLKYSDWYKEKNKETLKKL